MKNVEKCRCDGPNRECRRAGLPMVGRLWEICSGRCPSERPCTISQSENYRRYWDSNEQVSTNSPHPYHSRIYLRLQLWWRINKAKRRRYLRFLQAVLRHVLAGLPRASAADVEARRRICDPCFWRDKKTDTCTQCGCRLGGKKELVAKLSWAGEKCPLYDVVKRPGQYWGAVKGETVFRRMCQLLSRLLA